MTWEIALTLFTALMFFVGLLFAFSWGYSWGVRHGKADRVITPLRDFSEKLKPKVKLEVYKPLKDPFRKASGKDEQFFD